MAIDFPDSPSTNDTYTVNGRTYTWNGEKWLRTKPELTSVVPTLTISSDLTVDTDTLHVDATNDRVGIGTTSPNHSLSFGSPANGTRSLALWENGTAFYGLGNDTNRLALYASNSAGTAERMVINSDGDVGIGTTSPNQVLDVDGALAVRGKMVIGTSTFTQEPWSGSTIAFANYGSIGTQGSYRASWAWNYERGTDSGWHALGINSYTSAGGIEIGNDGILFRHDASYGATNAPTTRMIMEPDGKVGIGTTSPGANLQVISQNRAFSVLDSGTTNYAEAGFTTLGGDGPALGLLTGYTVVVKTGTSRAGLSDTAIFYAGGNIKFPTGTIESDGTYSNTTGSGANMHISSGGYFYRSTSSGKYKTDVETMEDSYADAILNLRPVWYRSLNENDPSTWGYWGFIAEEVADVDPRLVSYGVSTDYEWQYDDEGQKLEPNVADLTEPESVQYDRMVPHLVNLVKRQQTQIDTLTTQNAALTTRIEALEAN